MAGSQTTANCPICNSEVSKTEHVLISNEHLQRYVCPRCGDYFLHSGADMRIRHLLQNNKSKIAVLSHWVRTKHEANHPDDRNKIELSRELVENIIKRPPPKLTEQADNFVLWLGDKTAPAEEVIVEGNTDQAITGAKTPEEFHFMLSHLSDDGIIKAEPRRHAGIFLIEKVILSFRGWEYYDRLKRGAVDSRKAFMAMGYGDNQLDKVVDETFKPSVEETGFELYRLVDKPQPAGLIDDRLRIEIQTSRFLIADLTHENAGAYWEAGYAEGLGKPVIYTCQNEKFNEQKTHFDTNHHLTVIWDVNNLNEAAEKLKATIRATLPGEAKLTDDRSLQNSETT